MKPSASVWMRLNSSPLLRAIKPNVARRFVAHLAGHSGKLKSLDHLEPHVLGFLNHRLSHQSNDALEREFLEYLKGSRP